MHDVSDKCKNANILLDLVLIDIHYMVVVLEIIVVAWCLDTGGNAAKMRRQLVELCPYIIVLDCWAHQVSKTCTVA